MNYSELKEKAKELGLPYFGIGKAELQASINAKLAENGEQPIATDTIETNEEPEITEAPKEPEVFEEPKQPEANKEPEVTDVNVAIVSNNNYEVRRYTQEIHGDIFKKLANQFATHHQYKVEFVNIKSADYCRNCGKQLDN